MSRTLCEQLHGKIGQKVRCDYCLKNKVFNDQWRLTSDDGDKKKVCPDCEHIPQDKSLVLVNI